MSLTGSVADKDNAVEAPSVGNIPLFRVTLLHETEEVRVLNVVPSLFVKSQISLAGKVPTSISVLSKVKLNPSLWVSDIGYPNWNPRPYEFAR